MIGVNLSGAEFGKIGGAYGYNYTYPSASDIQYYAATGVDFVRLPVKWERLQPTAGGALDPAEMARLTKFLNDANAAGVKVIVDLHNFGTYYGDKLGSAKLPDSQFADFWSKLATAIGTNPAVMGYDIMNEPHDLGGAGVWPSAAQAAVDAIRKVDTTHNIYVEGNNWANAVNWSAANALLDIKDPANKIVYEAHLYLDKDMSGTYKGTYDQEGANAMTGAARLADFTHWLELKGAKGFIGELAVPDNDPRWLTALDNTYTAMKAAGLDSAYWGAGSWWGDYPLALRNADGSASTQLAVLKNHIAAEDAADAAAAVAAAAAKLAAPVIDADKILTGTDGFDNLVGGSGNDKIIFSGGYDKYDGGAGIDTLDFSAAGANASGIVNLATGIVAGSLGGAFINNIENVTGGAGGDILTGDAKANVLIGNGGNDTLDGGEGADRLVGGTGNDTYIVDNAGDVVIEAANEGYDTVKSSVDYTLTANVEKLMLTGAGAINGTGNALDNVIIGNDAANILRGGDGNDTLQGGAGNDTLEGGNGDDTLDGGTGADRMTGGAGNDTYVVDNAGDVVVEAANGGTDTVMTSLSSYTLSANVEKLIFTLDTGVVGHGNELANTITGGAGADTLYGEGGNDSLKGGAGNDKLFGGDGNDWLDGGTGADIMTGGTGDDTYIVDNAGDQVIEKPNEGYDTVISSVSFTLSADVEALTLSGTDAINGTGNALANVLTGNDAANILKGMAGNDTIYGGGGNDVIDGGDGDDILVGGAGADTLTGGAGKDVFKFTALSDSTPTARDTITDFLSGTDKIDLSKIDASLAAAGNQAFTLIGTNAFSKKAGELHYAVQHAADGHSFTLVEGDTNGDGVADFALVLDHYAAGLKATDFVL